MKHTRLLLIILIALLALPLAAQEESGPAPVGLRPDAPPYALHGPYWVGTMEMVIEPESERPLPLTVWYPALNPDKQAENITYNIPMKWIPMPEYDYVVYGHALLNAAPNRADGPYPLVVFSHGYSLSPAWYAYLVEHLASYGFVVVGPDHPGIFDDAAPFGDALPSGVQRPSAISRTIDFAESLNQDNELFAGLIDIEQTALTGHSAGGFTSLASAGALFSFQVFKARCATFDEPPPICEIGVAQETMVAQLAGLDSPPEGPWPSWGDTRIKAIIPMAPDGAFFEEVSFAEITVPMLMMGGDMDILTPYDWGPRPAYDYASSPQKSLVTFESGNHYLFQPSCAQVPWLPEVDSFFMCSDAVWDIDRAHDLINHFTTAFLLDVLKGDAEAHAALLAENVSFPGITYETTMR